jgi:glycosyltransferase involved in cell wall biosynthesis
MGKAVVASRTGAGPEIIEHEHSGLLCDPFDSRSIADQLISILRNASLRQALGRQARVNVVEYFSADAVAAKNEEFYLETVRRKRSPVRVN